VVCKHAAALYAGSYRSALWWHCGAFSCSLWLGRVAPRSLSLHRLSTYTDSILGTPAVCVQPPWRARRAVVPSFRRTSCTAYSSPIRGCLKSSDGHSLDAILQNLLLQPTTTRRIWSMAWSATTTATGWMSATSAQRRPHHSQARHHHRFPADGTPSPTATRAPGPSISLRPMCRSPLLTATS
jgi:hypothetical protein